MYIPWLIFTSLQACLNSTVSGHMWEQGSFVSRECGALTLSLQEFFLLSSILFICGVGLALGHLEDEGRECDAPYCQSPQRYGIKLKTSCHRNVLAEGSPLLDEPTDAKEHNYQAIRDAGPYKESWPWTLYFILCFSTTQWYLVALVGKRAS